MADLTIPPEPPGESTVRTTKKNNKSKKNKDKKKGKGGIIAIVLVVLLLGGGAAVIAADIGGIRENHIMPYLRNAPLVGSFIPQAEEPGEELTREELERLLRDANLRIESLENQLSVREQQLAEANFHIRYNLEPFRNQWNSFLEARAALDQFLAHADPYGFTQFFAGVRPENVHQLYNEATALIEMQEQILGHVRTFNGMSAAAAGEILQIWMRESTLLMVRVLNAMSPPRRGEILQTLDPAVASTMLLLTTSPPVEFVPLLPDLHEIPFVEMPTDIIAPPPPDPEDDEDYENEADDTTEETEVAPEDD